MDELAYLKHTKNLIVGNSAAKVALRNAKTPTGDDIAKTKGEIEKELQKFKLKVT